MQIPTLPTTITAIMNSPHFALGAADACAGRGYRTDYDTWHANSQWSYDRGRMWATLARGSVVLKRNGKVTREAMAVYRQHFEDII